jgi:hypothetical protein
MKMGAAGADNYKTTSAFVERVKHAEDAAGERSLKNLR